MAHRWPGNVRELQNVIERAVIMCDKSALLEPVHLGFGRRAEATTTVPVAAALPIPAASPATAIPPVFRPAEPAAPASNSIVTLEEIEKRHILATLEHTKGNRTRAAELLQISIRTLRNKLNEYGYKTMGGAAGGVE